MKLEFGPQSDTKTLIIQFCLIPGASSTGHYELSHYPDGKDTELNYKLISLDLVDDTIISDISGPSLKINFKYLSTSVRQMKSGTSTRK